MKFIQLCALFIGAFLFLQPAHADINECPDGGTFYDGYGCGVPAELTETCKLINVTKWPDVHPTNFRTVLPPLPSDVINTTCPANTNVTEYADCANNIEYSYSLPDSCSTEPFEVTMTRTVKRSSRYVPRPPEQPHPWQHQNDVYTNTQMAVATWQQTEDYMCPPESHQLFVNPFEIEGLKLCFKPVLPCDCSELQGMAALPSPSFLALKGSYTDGNTPECLDVADSETGQKCQCQFVAKKWLQFNAGFTYERWVPYPIENGGSSGTYTGAACNAEATSIAPDEKEECFTLKSGIKWCWANPDEKCSIVNGQEQCDSGCGYINGDFVCYETEEDPIIPRDPKPKDPIDDEITDPNKSINDMVKGDFKEVNRGIENRLNNVIITNENIESAVEGVENEVKKTNSKLDGIGRQLDGQGKTLKGIEKGLGDAFGDEGSPDGSCEGDCIGSWYETAYPDGMVGIWQEHSEALQQTPMFGFLNQFQLSPNGTQPDLNVCFNLGAMGDFGCSSFEIPAIIWPFIKIVILISAAFLCRALIFGG